MLSSKVVYGMDFGNFNRVGFKINFTRSYFYCKEYYCGIELDSLYDKVFEDLSVLNKGYHVIKGVTCNKGCIEPYLPILKLSVFVN